MVKHCVPASFLLTGLIALAGCGGADGPYTSRVVPRSTPTPSQNSPAPTPTPTPDFAVAALTPLQTVFAGEATTFNLTATGTNGFSQNVAFAVEGVPAGTQASFTPSSLVPGASASVAASVLNVQTSATTPTGTFDIAVSATPDTAATKTTRVTLNVTSLSVGVTPATQTLNTGASVTYTVTVAPVNGFAGNVNLSLTGLPTSVVSAVSPSKVTLAPGQNSEQTATVTLSLPGSVGGQRVTVPFEVVVTPAGTTANVRAGATVILNSLGNIEGAIQ